MQTENGNLPKWTGAAGAYSRAYRILDAMGRNGHATPKRGRIPGSVSGEMSEFIEVLNSGEENRIKSHILKNLAYLA